MTCVNFGIGPKKLISAEVKFFTQAELRRSPHMEECTAKLYARAEFEFLVFGSKHSIVLFADHKPIS